MAKPKPERCNRWPDCICAEKWRHYQDAPIEHFEEAGPVLQATLACVSANCPNPKFRAAATLQLLHPIWTEVERLQ